MSPLSLHGPDPTLFFSKNDPDDLRFGDVTLQQSGEPSDEVIDDIPSSVKVVLVGMPQHIGVVRNGGRPGAAGGPEAIRRAFYRLASYDVETDTRISSGYLYDIGDIDCSGELEEIHDRLAALVTEIVGSGRTPVILGGGHDVTYAGVSGVERSLGRLGLFNFDAHLDVRPPTPTRNSGTSIRMGVDEGLLDPRRTVEFGIQAFANAESHVEWFRKLGGTIWTLEAMRRTGFQQTLRAALLTCGEQYYGTLDIDGVRAAEAPGVSAPMPDGLSSAELLEAARGLGEDPGCVALDIAEMNPAYDRDGITARLSAHALARFLSGHAGRTR